MSIHTNRVSTHRKPQIRGESRNEATRGAAGMERRKARRLDRGEASWSTSAGAGHETPASNQSIFQTKSDQHPRSWIDRPIDSTDLGDGPPRHPGPGGGPDSGSNTGPDLRRRTRRDHAELLTQRAAWISAPDRELVEAVYREGHSVASYVRAHRGLGFERWTERSARRRLRRLVERLASPRFAFVIAARSSWPTTRRRVAMAVVVQGQTLRDTARTLGLSLHAVRRHIDAVDALYTEARAATPEAATRRAVLTADRTGRSPR